MIYKIETLVNHKGLLKMHQMYHVPEMPYPQMPIPPQPFRSIEMNQESKFESKLESKFNMYERQIDQLFEFVYQSKDDIHVLFEMKDKMSKAIDMIDSNISRINISELKQYKECIVNYYHLELENKKRMVVIEFYQCLLFIVQFVIILALWLFFYKL